MERLKSDTTYQWQSLIYLREVSRAEEHATYGALPYPACIYKIEPETYRMVCQACVAPIVAFTLQGTQNEVLNTGQTILITLGYKRGPHGLRAPGKIDLEKAKKLVEHPIIVRVEEW